MNHQQDLHSQSLAKTFSEQMKAKYAAGVKEHGGNLWEVNTDNLLDMAIEEVLDLYVYLQTLKENLLTSNPIKDFEEIISTQPYTCGKCTAEITWTNNCSEIQGFKFIKCEKHGELKWSPQLNVRITDEA